MAIYNLIQNYIPSETAPTPPANNYLSVLQREVAVANCEPSALPDLCETVGGGVLHLRTAEEGDVFTTFTGWRAHTPNGHALNHTRLVLVDGVSEYVYWLQLSLNNVVDVMRAAAGEMR